MSNVPSDALRSFQRKPARTSIQVDAIANAAGVPSVGVTRNKPSNCRGGCSSKCRLPFMFVTGMVSFFDTTAAPPNCGAGRRNSAILTNGFADRIDCFAPTELLPHHQCPIADVLRTGISVREHEVHIERPDGLRGIALVDIEAIKDIHGNVVGAVNCFQDITERKRSEAQIVNLAREAKHRTKNILATVLATVRDSAGALWKNIIVGQLRGEVHFDWRDQGLACEIALPLV